MLRNTLEEATLELNKPTEVADFHVQYNPPGMWVLYVVVYKLFRLIDRFLFQ